MKWLVLGLVAFASLIGSFGALFLKKGSKQFRVIFTLKNILKTLKNWRLMLGIVLYGFSTIFFIYALKLEELSVVYPLTSITYVFVTLLSIWLLKEKINKWKILGVACIVFGVILVRL